ncbi:TPA: transposase [Salmonella enterica subsp. enterica serovar Eastbourne]|nr:transposase [Salmonella enterica subsp. enterica serovar Eastbourne]HDN7577088.1 transposase [Salmonella enterica subsp. enterica serovar Eastbourne]
MRHYQGNFPYVTCSGLYHCSLVTAAIAASSCEPGISISKLALENGVNNNLLFKWRQQWHEGKLLLPSTDLPQLLPVTLDAPAGPLAMQPELPADTVSENILTLLIQELKR